MRGAGTQEAALSWLFLVLRPGCSVAMTALKEGSALSGDVIYRSNLSILLASITIWSGCSTGFSDTLSFFPFLKKIFKNL